MKQQEDIFTGEMYRIYGNKENFSNGPDSRHQPPIRRCSYSQVDIIDHSFDVDHSKKDTWLLNERREMSPQPLPPPPAVHHGGSPLRRCSYSQVDIVDHASYDSDNKKESWGINETIQKLYDVDSSISRRMFLDEYFTFMKKKGYLVTKIPIVGKKPLDLFGLYNAVQKFGGFEQASQKRKWSKVVRDLNLPTTITSAAYTLRTQFEKLLYRFECYKRGVPVNKKILIEEQKSYDTIKKLGNWNTEQVIRPVDLFNTYINEKRRHDQPVIEGDNRIRDPRESPLRELSYGITKGEVKEEEKEDEEETTFYIKRAKSEEIYRRTSIDEMPTMYSRSESCGDLHHYSRNERKRRYSPSFTEDEQEFNNNNNNTPSKKERISSPSHRPSPLMMEKDQIVQADYTSKKEDLESLSTNGSDQGDRQEQPQPRKSIFEENKYTEKHGKYNESLYSREKRSLYNEYRGSSPLSRQHHPLFPPSPYSAPRPELSNQCACDECKQKARYHVNGTKQSYIDCAALSDRDSSRLIPTPIQSAPTPPPVPSPSSLFRYQSANNKRKEYEQQRFPGLPPPLQPPKGPPIDLDQRYKSYRRDYRGPYNCGRPNNKLSTNPTEMNLKIKERTENAIVLSIVVDGVYYSGTLLTSLKR